MNIPPEELKKAADSILNLSEDELKRFSEEHEVKEPLNLTRLVDDFFNRSDEELMADIKKFENDPAFIALRDYKEGDEVPESVKKEPDYSRVALIIRGVSGSNKSTFADYLKYIHTFGNICSWVEICEADEFMLENGEYKFNPEKLGYAHKSCQEKFKKALSGSNPANLVIVSNTSTRESDVNNYLQIAKKYGYTCFVIVMENRNGTKNSHNVPIETLYRQERQLKESIKLV